MFATPIVCVTLLWRIFLKSRNSRDKRVAKISHGDIGTYSALARNEKRLPAWKGTRVVRNENVSRRTSLSREMVVMYYCWAELYILKKTFFSKPTGAASNPEICRYFTIVLFCFALSNLFCFTFVSFLFCLIVTLSIKVIKKYRPEHLLGWSWYDPFIFIQRLRINLHVQVVAAKHGMCLTRSSLSIRHNTYVVTVNQEIRTL